MSYVRVDSSVRTNRKFLQAGPAASWLWLCGTAYCQETLTDGFIPFEALRYLGVEQPKPLIVKLVRARLWEEVDGGWRVHDYLEHNKSAADIKTIKEEKRNYGKKGGEASGRSRVLKQSASDDSSTLLNQTVNPVVAVAVAAPVVDVLEGGSQGETLPPLDVWLRELQRQYPEQRVTIGHLTESAFHQQFLEDPRPADVVWRDMLEGLTSQKGGYEWRVKGMVPSLEKWLREGRWRQRHDEAPVSAVVSEKTSRTLTAAAEFIKGGRS